jgi:predicted Zn-dependent peptidase
MEKISVPEIRFEQCRFENGLNLVLHRNGRTPLVHVALHYKVGSSYERPGSSGFAHLFEHMMFQGSENVGKNEHGRYIDEAGGRWNAATNKDRTNYYETVPSNFQELAFWLEADRMRSLEVTRENFENQRQTVIEEKKQAYDNRPYGSSFLRLDELAYHNWAYAHSIIGTPEDLNRATLQDALDFHQAHYGPGNATLVVAGDVEPDLVLSQVDAHFSSIPDRTRPQEPKLDEPLQTEEKWEVIKDALAVLPAVTIAYHMPNLGSPQYYALTMLALILADGDSSRFYRKFIYENNWITGLFAGPNQYKGPGLFRIWFQIQSEIQPQIVIDSVNAELKEILDRGITDTELEKARNQVVHRFVARLSTVSQVGELLAHYASYFDDPQLVNTQMERYFSVTSEEILETAQEVLIRDNRTLILTEPRSDG